MQFVHELERGSHINGRYTILDPIGHGTTATVYHAIDRHNRREVAIKFYPHADLTYLGHEDTPANTPAREVEVLQYLTSQRACTSLFGCPYEVIVYNYVFNDEELSGLIIVQELLLGKTLEQVDDEYPDEPEYERRWIILGRLLDSLSHINNLGVRHNDIHPGNMMWDGKDVRLIDFANATIDPQRRYVNESIMAVVYIGRKLMGIGDIRRRDYIQRQKDFYDLEFFVTSARRSWEETLSYYNELNIGSDD